MNNEIKLKSINELLGMNFFIPNYQRGYRWTDQQVRDLLTDIDTFKVDENSWYCLQPLVLKKLSQEDKVKNALAPEEDWYELIDGQQRITTIFLIIHYFNEMWVGKLKIAEPQIKYETRKYSSDFLKNIEIDLDTNLVKEENGKNIDNIDYYHISTAYETIHKWVTEQQNSFDNNKFQSKFKANTQVIWYELKNDNNPIDTFIRVNMGKIPLTNSELIKALFLQKRNFDDATSELRQIEIANEWDRMEYTLQNDDFWWFLNKKPSEQSARIEFIFDLMCRIALQEDKELADSIGTDNYATFRFFNNKFSNSPNSNDVTKTWNEVKDYFLAFEEWFSDPIWYHYVGFLIHSDTSKTDTAIDEIYNLFKGAAKNDFLSKLIEKIRAKFEKITCNILTTGDKTTYTIDLPFANKHKPKIRELLLLFNIEYIVKQYKAIMENEHTELFIRFPFEIYKKESWDIEHIDSFTENSISDDNAKKEWLETAKDDLGDDVPEELQKDIQLFIAGDKSKSFDELKAQLVEIAQENTNNEGEKNSIGNLTLLDAKTNRGYGNALFPTKRRIIIEKDFSGKFIPICTKNIFLKYFDKKGTSRTRWTSEDIINYQNHLGLILQDFLPFKTLTAHE